MPRIVAVAVLVVLAACHSAPPPAVAPAPAEQLSPEVIHARVAGVLAYGLTRAIPAGDTFVTWSLGKAVLYTTVSRTDSTVASSLVNNDGKVGTAEAVWQGGLQRKVSIRWTQGTDTLMALNVQFEAGVIHLAGARDTALQAPSLPWAVADYGMEDQLLPLIEAAGVGTRRRRLAIYRPSPSRWDTITIACRRTQGATLATETEPDRARVFWTITADGALVRLTRDRHRDFERRPLEMSTRVADYLRLRELREH